MYRLFSYKLTHDTGFDPNPFWGVLTLATCKPRIRLAKKPGDWIAGFTSHKLCGDPVGKERLIFLMEVSEKMPFADYFSDPRFKKKIPNLSKTQCIYRAGDNIYRPTSSNSPNFDKFEQLQNPYHDESNKQRDLSGKFVLVSKRFFYFGREALNIPSTLRPKVPKGQSAHGVLTHDQTLAQNFVNYIATRWDIGIHGAPNSWPKGDFSWKI